MKTRLLILLLGLPAFFVLHGWNENVGLIPLRELFFLSIKYILITILTYYASAGLLRNYEKGYWLSFFLLCLYFFFGAFKDKMEEYPFFSKLTAYSYLLPFMTLLGASMYFLLRRQKAPGKKALQFMRVLTLVVLALETGSAVFQAFNGTAARQDFGDRTLSLQKDLSVPTTAQKKPHIFWLVFDEYPSAASLRKNFGFADPLDSLLKTEGFYIAPEATSNYNYTHYSLTSTLDMQYLNGLPSSGIVTLRDLVRGNLSLRENNVTRYLERNGYRILNHSIYDLKGYPTRGILSFAHVPSSLLDHQTLFTRTWTDIGWQFPSLFSKNKKEADSISLREQVNKADRQYKDMEEGLYQSLQENRDSREPVFLLAHFLLPHEPFIYEADGRLHYRNGLNADRSFFLPQVQYTGTKVIALVRKIKELYGAENTLILVQGDHGFKFEEEEPAWAKESCRILYGVYAPGKNYAGWYPNISSVNSFRIIFNRYFNSQLPMLKDSSQLLKYR